MAWFPAISFLTDLLEQASKAQKKKKTRCLSLVSLHEIEDGKPKGRACFLFLWFPLVSFCFLWLPNVSVGFLWFPPTFSHGTIKHKLEYYIHLNWQRFPLGASANGGTKRPEFLLASKRDLAVFLVLGHLHIVLNADRTYKQHPPARLSLVDRNRSKVVLQRWGIACKLRGVGAHPIVWVREARDNSPHGFHPFCSETRAWAIGREGSTVKAHPAADHPHL